ncbi:MAG: hypothetical protein U9Q79_05360 [Candidatus Hydrogenedentes bacterium]|nr:hypothetical protein [Candidatus Hydrogenedentota bacterium]
MVKITLDDVAVENFVGYGVEWDPRGYDLYGVTDADFTVVRERVEWMRLPVARMMMLAKWCYLGEGKYDWDTREMQLLYRQLDVCQSLGTTVLLTDWGCERDWVQPPGITKTDDPKYAQVIAKYMDHLLNTKGYSCIKYFILVNEPNYEIGDFERWSRGVRNIAQAFAESGLNKQVTIAGPDHSNADEWFFKAVDQLGDVLGAYDVHRYATDANVAPGKLEDYFANQWKYARQNDPAATGKMFIVGEAGMNDYANHPASNAQIDTHYYGEFMADYAIQAAQAGSNAVCAWHLDDNSHRNFAWGLWSNKEQGMKLRPWFFPWALLARCVPAGSTIYEIPDPVPSLRVLAAKEGSDWTLSVVNRGDEHAQIALTVPGQNEKAARRYVYAPDDYRTDEKGYPLPLEEVTLDLNKSVLIDCPRHAMVMLTTLM